MNIFDTRDHRTPDHDVCNIFPSRWSPRAMNGEPIGSDILMSLFEAARWAPSCFNNQPWRFLYAHRTGPHWAAFLDLLRPQNREWCVHAAVLMVAVSNDTFDYNGKPDRSHSFDTGAAWENLALEGTMRGLVVHGMLGFDRDRARSELGIPDGFTVEAMIAVGVPGNPDILPDRLREQEHPSNRKPVEDFTAEGTFIDKLS